MIETKLAYQCDGGYVIIQLDVNEGHVKITKKHKLGAIQ